MKMSATILNFKVFYSQIIKQRIIALCLRVGVVNEDCLYVNERSYYLVNKYWFFVKLWNYEKNLFLFWTDRELKLSGNRIREFPVEVISLPRLKFLDLSVNEIQTIKPIGFENFQVRFWFVKDLLAILGIL